MRLIEIHLDPSGSIGIYWNPLRLSRSSWDVLNAPSAPGVLASHLSGLGGIISRPGRRQWWQAGHASVHCELVLVSVLACLVFVAQAGAVMLKD